MPSRSISAVTRAVRRSLTVAALGLVAASGVYAAELSDAIRRFDIPAQSTSDALNQFSRQSGLRLFFAYDELAGKQADALQGEFTAAEALKKLLAGSGLEYEVNADSVVLIKRPGRSAADASPSASLGLTDEVVVIGKTNTATKLDLTVRETPQSVTIIDRQRIEDQNTTEISKVLDQTVGLTYRQSGPLGADNNNIMSRGFYLNNYQVDGVARLSNFGFSNDIADMALFEQVEVVRGATGLLSGIGEPSGTVNLMRKRPTTSSSGYLSAQFGTFDSYRVEADASSALTSGDRVRGRLVGAYEDSDSFVDRLNLTKKVGYGIVQADLTDSTILTVGVEYQEHRSEGAARFGSALYYYDGRETNFPRSVNTAARWSYHTRDNLSVFSVLEQKLGGDWNLRFDLEHSRREWDSLMAGMQSHVLLVPETGATIGTAYAYRWSSKPRQNSANLSASGSFTLFGRDHELALGANIALGEEQGDGYPSYPMNVGDYREFIATGQLTRPDFSAFPTIYESEYNQSGIFAATRLKPADRLSVILGGRVSNWEVKSREIDEGVVVYSQTNKGSGVFTPYAGIVFDVTRAVTAYVSYADIFQPTTVIDENAQVIDPATGINLETGLKIALFDDQMNISGAVFETKQDNVPQWVGILDDGRYYYRAVDGTKTRGYEIEVAGRIGPSWNLSGGFARSLPKDGQGQRWLVHIPTNTFKLYSSYRFDSGVLQGLTVGGNFRWQSEIENNNPQPRGLGLRYVQDAYGVLDLMAKYSVTPRVSAQLNVNNLFDKKYFTDVQLNGWYGEPRNAVLSVRFAY